MAIKEHTLLHQFYRSLPVTLLRAGITIGLFFWVFFSLFQGGLPKYPLFLLSWIIMGEVFYHFSLSVYHPRKTIQECTAEEVLDCSTHAATDTLLGSDDVQTIISQLLRYQQVQFLLRRLGIDEKTLALVSVNKDELLQKAYEIAKNVNGTYVTTMDLMAAYLLVTESESKRLFALKLKPIDLTSLLVWGRLAYPEEEALAVHDVSISGGGIGEGLVTGWTPETKNYTVDFSAIALPKEKGLVGRDKEYQEMIAALGKTEAANVLLVGERGVGKETLVEALARDSFNGRLTGQVNHKRIITLMVGPLLAGTGNRSEIESRLQAIVSELSHAGNIILYIPEIQEIMGESSYDLNLSGALLPYLKDSSLPIIASITNENYKKYMKKNGLEEVFSIIAINEPETTEVKKMLYKKIPEIERTTGVFITYAAVMKALTLAPTYLPDDVLPGSAIRLLRDAAQRAEKNEKGTLLLTPEVLLTVVEGKVHTSLAEPKKEEKKLLLHLEEELHKRVIGQSQAISVIAEAMRRLRTGVDRHEKPVSFLFLGPTGVGKTETAKALADLYFGGEEKMVRLDMSEYVNDAGIYRILGAPPGAGDERGELTDSIHDNPYTLILLDEFEKAHPKILDLFLQVLSDGRLTDNKGRTVSFANTIIIATSNAASEFIREEIQKGIPVDKKFQTRLVETLETTHLFKPELLNRFDGIVTFTPLAKGELEQITTLLLHELSMQLKEQDLAVTFDPEVTEQIVEKGSDEQFGARPLRRYIQDTIEAMIAKLKLEDKLERGDTVRIMIGTDDALTAEVIKPDQK